MISVRASRRAGVSALLGLPAALLAHTLLFGHAHAAAGSFHGSALGVGAAFALLAAALAGIALYVTARADSPHFARYGARGDGLACGP